MKYVQCELRRPSDLGEDRTVAFIPEEFAVLDRKLSLNHVARPQEVWTVTEVWGSIPDNQVVQLRKSREAFREVLKGH